MVWLSTSRWRPYFNPLRREGGDAFLPVICIPIPYFNPLRREGGD